jgi:hypothetical protein
MGFGCRISPGFTARRAAIPHRVGGFFRLAYALVYLQKFDTQQPNNTL